MSRIIVIIALCLALAATDLTDWRLLNSPMDLVLAIFWFFNAGWWSLTAYLEYKAGRP